MKRVHVLFVLGCETDETHCHDCGHVQWHGIDDEDRDGEPWCGDTSLSLDNCLDMDEHGAPLRADRCLSAQRAFDDAIRGAKVEALEGMRRFVMTGSIADNRIDEEIAKLGGGK